MLIISVRRQDLKLPRLPAINVAETPGIHLKFRKVNHPGHLHILMHPRILDRFRADSIEPLGQVAEGTMTDPLNRHDVLHLFFGEHALLYQ